MWNNNNSNLDLLRVYHIAGTELFQNIPYNPHTALCEGTHYDKWPLETEM